VAEPTQPVGQMVVCYFIVSDDVERSRRFYTGVLGGRVVFGPEPTNIALANSFITPTPAVTGGPPTGYRSTPPGNPTEPRLLEVRDGQADVPMRSGPNDQGARLCWADYEIVKVATHLEPARLFDPADLHRLEASGSDQPFDFVAPAVVVGHVEQNR
jgi:hypothetical protein